jgi:hypothetical protein
LRLHLIGSAGKKATCAADLRLLEAYRSSERGQPREILVSWVDPDEPGPNENVPHETNATLHKAAWLQPGLAARAIDY